MQSRKWLVAVVVMLIVGGFTHTLIKTTPAQEVTTSNTEKTQDEQSNTKLVREPLTTAVKMVSPSKEKTSNTTDTNHGKSQTVSPDHPLTADHTDSTNESADKKPSLDGITDEDAKKLIPFPFSHALTIFKDNDRQSYKQFSDTLESDDWDIKMQGQLVDAIYSHPSANALTIDSILCKAHICELRIIATNNKTWPLVMADMKLQPWWGFGNNFSIYEFGVKQDTQVKTIYFILLTRQQ